MVNDELLDQAGLFALVPRKKKGFSGEAGFLLNAAWSWARLSWRPVPLGPWARSSSYYLGFV